MAEWFVCVPGGDPVGPVSTSLLLLGIRSGKVPDDALVCKVGEKSWVGLFEAPELGDALPGPEAFRGAEQDLRYARKTLLGQGGMGEVHSCADQWIGREVAMKIAHVDQANQPHLRARFVREALVQGQLEHPSVVPVYDIGTRPDGALFFTMKRVRGKTLAAVVEGLRRGDPETQKDYGRRRLLSAMSSVCLAVSFAHSRGVVHRDLKPENVMLGDFGEVYVLDWGVAKVLEDAWAGKAKAASGAAPIGRTQAGAMVGTPGYASPEQVRGDGHVGEATDVYALGAILFELLVKEPLHRGTTAEALVAATLSAERDTPARRAPALGIPAELDALCSSATAADPRERLPSARRMHEAIERHLDGERDAERHRDLARRHAADAGKAFETATKGGPDAEAHRARGLREISAALALEPTNVDALRLLLSSLLEPPGELPPEAEAELQEVERRDRARAAGDAALAYSLMGLSLPMLLAMPVRRPVFFALLVGVTVAVTGYMTWIWRTGKADQKSLRWSVPLSFVLVGLTSTVFGPLVMVPGTAAVTVAAFQVSNRANLRTRLALGACGFAAILIPAALQLFGLAPSSYVFEPGGIRIVSNLVEFRPVPALALLAFGALSTVLATMLSVGRAVEALIVAERRNFGQAWRLRQMLPAGGGGAPGTHGTAP